MQDKNQNNIEETSYTNPRDVEPVVIGELRKEKIGRPMIVIELAVLFVIVLVGLPMINSMMNDENSVLYKFFKMVIVVQILTLQLNKRLLMPKKSNLY